MTTNQIVDEFYSLPPKYRTKDKLKQMLEAKEKPTNYEEWQKTLTDEQRKESDKELAKLVEEHNNPTAPASLVEELEKMCLEVNSKYQRKVASADADILAANIRDVLSRYRPTPTENIVWEIKEWEEEMFSLDRVTPSAHNKFKEIIRKYEERK